MIGSAVVRAPWGPIHLAADDDAIVGLEVLTTTEAFAASLRRRLGETPQAPGSAALGAAIRRRLAVAAEAVEGHLAGERDALDGVPYDLRGLSGWDRLVLAGVARVAWGDVISYGGLARSIGRPGAARATGAAVGRNPIGLIVPCHRVIAGDGSLGGYGGGWLGDRETRLAVKRRLLTLEGIAIPVGPGSAARPVLG